RVLSATTCILYNRCCSLIHLPPLPTLFPYTTLFRSPPGGSRAKAVGSLKDAGFRQCGIARGADRPVAELPPSPAGDPLRGCCGRSEEHTSELQSRFDIVCRLLLEKKKHRHTIIDKSL